jgi:hypothetical protein
LAGQAVVAIEKSMRWQIKTGSRASALGLRPCQYVLMELPIFSASAAIALVSASLSMSIALAEVRVRSAQEQTARLRVGDMVQIDGSDATLTFKAVTRDSRCPKGVRCIRVGEAVIVLELRGGGGETSTLTFDIPPGGGASQSLRGYRIEIVSLDPQAEADVEIAPGDYTATLAINVM